MRRPFRSSVRAFPLALLCLALAAQAQPVRSGVTLPQVAADAPPGPTVTVRALVLDAETGDPLPGATAQAMGTDAGASADRDGRLVLEVELPAVVVVRFVGYAPNQVPLGLEVAPGPVERTVRLSPSPFSLGEVTVTGEPPGEVLWRRLLARRQELARRMGAYSAEGYSRLLLARDGVTDVRPVGIGLEETVSNLSWIVGLGMREEVVARRRRPFGGPFRWARMAPVLDLYFEDVIALDGLLIPSPTRPDALDHYAFRLGETVEADGRRYLDLAVIPRGPGMLSGRIRVVDTLLVIAEADLRLTPTNRAGVVDDFQASYRWTYRSAYADAGLADSVWLPRRFEREGLVTVNLPGYRVPTVRFRQTSVFDLVVPSVPGSAYRLRQRYRNPRDAYAGHEAFRVGRSLVPLDSLEVAVETSDWVRQSSYTDLLKRQDGIGFSLFGLSPGADLEGEDDE